MSKHLPSLLIAIRNLNARPRIDSSNMYLKCLRELMRKKSQVQNVGVNSPFGTDQVRQSIGQCASVRRICDTLLIAPG